MHQNNEQTPFDMLSGVIGKNVLETLPFGKYTRWVVERGLTPGQLRLMLQVLGIFRDHTDADCMLLTDPPALEQGEDMLHPRAVQALATVLRITRGDAPAPNLQQPGFQPEFVAQLEGDNVTFWAARLDERGLNTLLWDIGEFAVRHFGQRQLPQFSADSARNAIAGRALDLLVRLYRAEKLDTEAALRWVMGDAGLDEPAIQRSFVLYQQAVSSEEAGDVVGAIPLYEQSAVLDYARAQYRLGQLYEQGIGVSQDYLLAYDWYARAAGHGCQEAAFRLGEMHLNGIGVLQDEVAAYYWYQKAPGVAEAVDKATALAARNKG